jgi:hypothetical protein
MGSTEPTISVSSRNSPSQGMPLAIQRIKAFFSTDKALAKLIW